MQDAILVEDLHVAYRGKNGKRAEAVNGLSFRVSPGEVVGFLGPNGAGKSSTLKALMGFVTPWEGSALVFGEKAGSAAARVRSGYLPEVALYYPFLSPLETLLLYGELQAIPKRNLRAEANSLLETVGIAGSAKKQNRALSKGMLQRLGIAQALLGSPELLILDEMTSGLDPLGRRELREMLKERKEQGCTMFFSSHELSEVEMMCDRILVIDKGKLVEECAVASLKEQLTNFSLTFSASSIPEGWEVESLGFGTFRRRFGSKADLIYGIATIQAAGGNVTDLVAHEGSLEDYFVDVLRSAA